MENKLPIPIASKNLRLADIPSEDAGWPEIARFALTWDFINRYPNCPPEEQQWALIQDTCSIDDLRARLFFEQRRWNHFGRPPDERTLGEIRRVVALIRGKVEIVPT